MISFLAFFLPLVALAFVLGYILGQKGRDKTWDPYRERARQRRKRRPPGEPIDANFQFNRLSTEIIARSPR